MRTKRTLTIGTVLAVLAALLTLGVFRATRRVHAQDQLPPPIGERISLGMVGITQGQTLGVTVVNTTRQNDANYPPGPARVTLTFLNSDGQLFRNRDGSPVRRVVILERGHSAFLDLNYDDFPPGRTRLQLRAVVEVIPPAPIGNQLPATNDRRYLAAEAVKTTTGQTGVFVGDVSVARTFNPQPDPTPRQ